MKRTTYSKVVDPLTRENISQGMARISLKHFSNENIALFKAQLKSAEVEFPYKFVVPDEGGSYLDFYFLSGVIDGIEQWHLIRIHNY